jgi:dolichyl-phosphate-mannose--protein O-mannosyl transferase
MTQKLLKLLPITLILLLAIFTRFWRLGIPDTYHFDEVYHAFTAKEMLLGNPAAWEFWNTPPAGFAYEWTHPPLAKLFMAGGMIIFGINPFGWRFFGALAGVGIILLVYLLAKKLFKSQFIAVTASLLLIFEGLLFVQSRIGMNDVYFIFFMLLSLYFLLSRKYFFSGLFWGFSLAAKWAAVYTIFIFAVFFIHEFLQKSKPEKRLFIKKMILVIPVFYIVIPLIIYVLSYSPLFFLNDPNISEHIDLKSKIVKIEQFLCQPIFSSDFCNKLVIVWNVNQQMYWYHTRLSATHAYQSLWYTWPFDWRPVYYYVGNFGDKIAQIYALGNPIILWSGIIAVIFAILRLTKRPMFALGLILTAYLSFWLPWSLSPRIMFLYHYTPSVIFLALLLAVSLKNLWEIKIGKILVSGYLLLVIITFIYFYPHFAAYPVSTTFNNSYFWLNSWH